MWRKGGWLAALVIASLFVGCLGGSEDPGEADAQPSIEDEDAARAERLTKPEWQVGQYWTWSSDAIGEYTYVVTEDAGRAWIVDTDSESNAFFHARQEISFLGEIRKSDLAGSQNGSGVKYFDWPLETGKSWTTTWDGVQRHIQVVSIEDGVAELEAHQDGRLAVAYEYDAWSKWFGDITFFNADETPGFTVELVRSGQDWQGEVVRFSLEEVDRRSGTIGATPTNWGGEFTVDGDVTDLWLSFQADCPSGGISFGVNSQQGQEGWGTIEPCPAEPAFEGVVVEQPEGSWSYGMQATSPQEEGSYALTLLLRTIETIPVGG